MFFFLCYFYLFYFKTITKFYFKSELLVDLFLFLLGFSCFFKEKKERKYMILSSTQQHKIQLIYN